MDPRAARSRSRLQSALLELARERDLDDITVADLTERAGVNRSTFYQHYEDLDALLADALDAFVAEAGADLSGVSDTLGTPEPPDVLVRFVAHLAENATLYRRTLGDHGSALATARLRDRIEEVVRAGIAEFAPIADADGDDLVPPDVVAASIAASVVAALRAWLDIQPLPSARAAAGWVWRLLPGTVTAVPSPSGPAGGAADLRVAPLLQGR